MGFAAHATPLEFHRVIIGRRTIWMPQPTPAPATQLVDRADLSQKALAAWLAVGNVPPLSFRLYGPPGTGKNTLVFQLAEAMGGRSVYVLNAHEELSSEDVACTAVGGSGQTVEYVASPVMAAAYYGGVAFFDEIAKAPVGSLDALVSLLDDRRVLTSVVAGITIRVHPDFRFAAALNDGEDELLPDYIRERLSPAIRVDHPPRAVLLKILRAHLPAAEDIWFAAFDQEVQQVVSSRTAVSTMSYAYRQWLATAEASLGEAKARRYMRNALAEVAGTRQGGESS
jgi:MoxR-like ATPase